MEIYSLKEIIDYCYDTFFVIKPSKPKLDFVIRSHIFFTMFLYVEEATIFDIVIIFINFMSY
jgi:hypothetical protein